MWLLLFNGVFVYNSQKEVAQMRLIFRVAIVLILCLVAVALPTTPARAQGAWINLSPDDGVPGEEITVYGYNFTAEARVYVYYYPDGSRIQLARVETNDDGEFEVDVIIPESYTGAHEVYAEDEDDIDASEDFDVEPGLTVDPEEGPVGTDVTIEGHGFAEGEEDIEVRYYFDGNYTVIADEVEADEDGWWEVDFQIPTSDQGGHEIDAEGDDSSLAEVQDVAFEVMPSVSLDRYSGSVGESITMTGNGFVANERDITILFDGEAVETEIRADDSGYWQESFEVPELAGDTYDVTAEGEYTDKEDIDELSFEIGPGLVLSPDQGHVGTDLTVTGGGFTTDENVIVRYDGTQEATARSDSNGSFTVTFPVPESRHGVRQVTAEVNGLVEATATFTMESQAPDVPDLISPADESRVGIIGSVRPTFEWSEVFDASGVRYNLHIAGSADATTTGAFADPVASVTGIVGTNYTLNATEALGYGIYYWVVQAVDGAENEGDWTAPRSFRAGALPLWAFIVAIVAVAAGIGAAVYFFWIRRRIYYY
jgi:hypothetical protein